MTYTLFIWTVVAMAGTGTGPYTKIEKDWRPIAEFRIEEGRMNKKTALEMCEAGARELVLKRENYRCVRTQ